MLVSDFDFDLPPEQIAAAPAEPRDASRLLCYDRSADRVEHGIFRDLPRFLAAGDLLVLNDTQVVPNRLFGRRGTGARVEVLILERRGRHCRGYVKPARKIRPNERVPLEDGRLVLVAAPDLRLAGGQMDFALETTDGSDVEETLFAVGRAPLPPYIPRDGSEDPSLDRERYQTVFAAAPGAVAAPTAGLHFTPELLDTVRAQGVETATVTLHVGAGTFSPVRVERVEDHAMHSEQYELGDDVAAAVAATRARGGRVIAVGTTATRTLESCADPDREGQVVAARGSTDIFLYPGRPLRVVDALITNFHLPGSTLLMLVAAMTGREQILRVYREAVADGYRFYSYGDAMLIHGAPRTMENP